MPRGPFTQPPPDLERFKGRNVGAFLRELTAWLAALVRWVDQDGGGARGGPGLALARLPSGGIAAGATGVVTYYTDPATLGTATATVTNPFTAAAPSLKKCVVGPMAGVPGLAVHNWDC